MTLSIASKRKTLTMQNNALVAMIVPTSLDYPLYPKQTHHKPSR